MRRLADARRFSRQRAAVAPARSPRCYAIARRIGAASSHVSQSSMEIPERNTGPHSQSPSGPLRSPNEHHSNVIIVGIGDSVRDYVRERDARPRAHV